MLTGFLWAPQAGYSSSATTAYAPVAQADDERSAILRAKKEAMAELYAAAEMVEVTAATAVAMVAEATAVVVAGGVMAVVTAEAAMAAAKAAAMAAVG
jgi:hypothetical protein